MRYLHTMIRVRDLSTSIDFYCRVFGLVETRRIESDAGRFTLVFLSADEDLDSANAVNSPVLELTHNWDGEENFDGGRNFGHLAYSVDDIYASCQRLIDLKIVINRPPRDGRMAFIKSPDDISIELLQAGDALEVKEPWASMPSVGYW